MNDLHKPLPYIAALIRKALERTDVCENDEEDFLPPDPENPQESYYGANVLYLALIGKEGPKRAYELFLLWEDGGGHSSESPCADHLRIPAAVSVSMILSHQAGHTALEVADMLERGEIWGEEVPRTAKEVLRMVRESALLQGYEGDPSETLARFRRKHNNN